MNPAIHFHTSIGFYVSLMSIGSKTISTSAKNPQKYDILEND